MIVNQRIYFYMNLTQDQFSQPIDKSTFQLILKVAGGVELLTAQDVDMAFFKLCEKRQELGISFDEMLKMYIFH